MMSEELKKKNGAEANEQLSDTSKDQTAPEEPAPPANEEERVRLKLAEAEKAADTFKDQFLRKAAEFDNYKRRSEADFINLVKNANEGLITSLLPVIDDFERSLKAGRDAKEFDAFYKGVELIYNKFLKLLEAQGLAAFESTGQPFNVDYHDALLQIPRSDVPPHTVVEEVQRGFKLNDKILRHAKVIVSSEMEAKNEPSAARKDNEEGKGEE